MTDIKCNEKAIKLLEDFVTGEDRSLSFAGKIEVDLEEAYPEDKVIQDFISEISCYRPGGGEYLYDEDEIANKCIYLIKYLKEK